MPYFSNSGQQRGTVLSLSNTTTITIMVSIRHSLLLLVLLLIGTDISLIGIGMEGCLAFQNPRYSTSSVAERANLSLNTNTNTAGRSTSISISISIGDSEFHHNNNNRRRRPLLQLKQNVGNVIRAFTGITSTPNSNNWFQNRRDLSTTTTTTLAASSRSSDGENDNETEETPITNMTQQEGWEFAMQLEKKGSFQPSSSSRSKGNSAEELEARAHETARLKVIAEQDEKLKQAEAEVARLRAEAQTRKKAEEDIAIETAAANEKAARAAADAEEQLQLQQQRQQELQLKAMAEAEEKAKAAKLLIAKAKEKAELQAIAEAEAKEKTAKLQAIAEAAAKEKAAKLQAIAEAEEKEKAAKLQAIAEAEEKEKAAKLQAISEAEEKERAAKLQAIAEAEEKAKLLAIAEAEEKAKAASEEERKRLLAEKKSQDLATLLKAKEEAARVMAEIDAKLTAEADKEEAERVAKLQTDAVETPAALDDADNEMLAKLMEEMEKVRIELDSRLQAEEEDQRNAQIQKEKEENETASTAADTKTEDLPAADIPNFAGDLSSELIARIKSGASYEPPVSTATAAVKQEQPAPVEKEATSIPTSPPPHQPMPDLTPPASRTIPVVETKIIGSKKEEFKPSPQQPMPDLTTPASRTVSVAEKKTIGSKKEESKPPPQQPMPDLTPPTSKTIPVAETKTIDSKEESTPKWMVDWKKEDESTSSSSSPKEESKTNEEVKVPEETRLESKKEDETAGEKALEEISDKEKMRKDKDKKDPRTTGRSSRENLFDVIGRTADSSVSMDEMTKHKKKTTQQQKRQETPPPLEAEVLQEPKEEGLPSSFGDSVVGSYKTGETRRPKPDNLKRKGPPADFGSFAAAASGKQARVPPNSRKNKTPIYDVDKGPPASFGASVAIASSGDVPQDLLSRGTASTDAGVSSSPPESSKSSTKKKDDSNIIDVVDAVYTKKDEPPKKKTPAPPAAKKAAVKETKVPTPSPPLTNTAPALQVETTVPPLQVEKTIPTPIRNGSKKKEDDSKVREATVAQSISKKTHGTVNVGKAALENAPILGKRKSNDEKIEPLKDPEPKASDIKSEIEKEEKGRAMEDRVADLLKEAFSLSKEDSRVAELLKGVVSITTGKDKEEEKLSAQNTARGRKKIVSNDEDGEEEDTEVYVDEDEEDEEQEDTAIMGRTRNRRNMGDVDDLRTNDPIVNPSRPRPPIRRIESTPIENEWGDDGFIETPISSNEFDDYDGDGYFEDDDSDYFEYNENDTWRGRDRDTRRPEQPTGGRYSVRPPPSPQAMDQQDFESDDDYYFLKFGAPRPPYDDRVDDRYFDDEDDYLDDNDDDGVKPGEPRPAFSAPAVDGGKKGPPASFGNFVADASMSKTGFAPSSLNDDIKDDGSSGGTIGPDGDEWGDEMMSNSGSMLSPRSNRGARVNGAGGGGASSDGGTSQAPFVVSEDQGNSGGRGRKGPPSSFGNTVGSASEMQTGVNPTQRSIEEEIANGGMATPTGMMATPRRKNPAVPSNVPATPTGDTRQGVAKKALFVVSDDDAGTPDFGSSVAEASGSRTGWAPKVRKRPTGGLEGGTTGGMQPTIKKLSSENSSQRPGFGSAVFDACPTVLTSPVSPNAKRPTSEADRPREKKESFESDLVQKHQRNAAVKLIDGGSTKTKPRQVQYSGSMMAPRVVRKNPPPTQDQENSEEEQTDE